MYRFGRTDVLIALSREGYEKYADELKDTGVLIYDEDLVDPDTERGTIRAIGIPATRLAEELGKRIVQNIVVVGFATAATEIVSKEAALEAVEVAGLAFDEAEAEFRQTLELQPDHGGACLRLVYLASRRGDLDPRGRRRSPGGGHRQGR